MNIASPKCPQLVTYAADEAHLRTAIAHGADHIILEDSKLAVRSYSDDFSQTGFDKITELAVLARALNPAVEVSVQIDKLLHQRHQILFNALIDTCAKNDIKTFRIQDPGLAQPICAVIPDAKIHVATETGYANAHGMKALLASRPSITRLVLSNDWSQALIARLGNALSCECEHQVHGPVLLQYTDRRLLTGYEVKQGEKEGSADGIAALGERRVRVEDRDYHFYDNQHGNSMYAGFDKALYKNIPQLMKLSLDAWLCDARGEGLEYLASMLDAYRSARDLYLADPDAYLMNEDDWLALQNCGRRPLKPGFFIANNTDYVFESQAQDHQKRSYAKRYLGKIVDSIKTKCFCIEALEDLHPGMYQVSTPEGREKKLHIQSMRDVSGNEIKICPAGDYVVVPWCKGLFVDCLLYKL